MSLSEIIIKIVVPILGLLVTASNIYSTWRINKLKLDADIREKNRLIEEKQKEEARKEEEEKRDKLIEEKSKTRIQIIISEIDMVKEMLNKVNAEVITVRSKLDDTIKAQEQHLNENSATRDFLKLYKHTLEQILYYFFVEDEKYKLILSEWGEQIEKFALRYIEQKISKPDIYDEYDLESAMEQMIENFYKISASLIPGEVDNKDFFSWMEGSALHAKSKILALELKKNGLSLQQVNKIVIKYIRDFAKKYSTSCNTWIAAQKKLLKSA